MPTTSRQAKATVAPLVRWDHKRVDKVISAIGHRPLRAINKRKLATEFAEVELRIKVYRQIHRNAPTKKWCRRLTDIGHASRKLQRLFDCEKEFLLPTLVSVLTGFFQEAQLAVKEPLRQDVRPSLQHAARRMEAISHAAFRAAAELRKAGLLDKSPMNSLRVIVGALANLAEDHLGIAGRISRASSGGPPKGPFINFCTVFTHEIGMPIGTESIAKALTLRRKR